MVNKDECISLSARLHHELHALTFATAGARLWNSLPADIVSCDTLPQFRRELDTFLFRLSYRSSLLLVLVIFFFVVLPVFARNSICAIAHICYRNSVRLDVRHKGGLYKNG